VPVSRRALLPILAVAVTALMLVASASAGMTYKTTLVMSEKFPAFHGKLDSKHAFCMNERKIKLYREKYGPDKLLGTTKSAPDGTWSIPIGNRLISGAYYSKVTKASSSEIAVTCLPAMSRLAVVD